MQPGFHPNKNPLEGEPTSGIFHEHLVAGDPLSKAISGGDGERFTHGVVVYELTPGKQNLKHPEHDIVNADPRQTQAINHSVTIVSQP